MEISWTPPAPRKGFKGAWDRFVGPGASRAEFWLMWVTAISAGLALPLIAVLKDFGWNAGKLIVAALIAMDLAGGVVTNATSAAKRWYHREGQGPPHSFAFVALHVVHVFLVAWLFGSMDWEFFGWSPPTCYCRRWWCWPCRFTSSGRWPSSPTAAPY